MLCSSTRPIDVDEIDAALGQFAQLVEIIAAIDDAGVDDCGRFCRHEGTVYDAVRRGQRAEHPDYDHQRRGYGIDGVKFFRDSNSPTGLNRRTSFASFLPQSMLHL